MSVPPAETGLGDLVFVTLKSAYGAEITYGVDAVLLPAIGSVMPPGGLTVARLLPDDTLLAAVNGIRNEVDAPAAKVPAVQVTV